MIEYECGFDFDFDFVFVLFCFTSVYAHNMLQHGPDFKSCVLQLPTEQVFTGDLSQTQMQK